MFDVVNATSVVRQRSRPTVGNTRLIPFLPGTHYAAIMDEREPAAPPAVVTRVVARLTELGWRGEATPISQAREIVSNSPGQLMVTSHLFHSHADHFFLVLLPEGHDADPIQLNGVLGESGLVEMTPESVEERTGHVAGGIAPVATETRSHVVLDISLSRSTTMWVPAGDPNWVFPSNYAQLLRLTAGTAAEVGDLPTDQDRTPPAS